MPKPSIKARELLANVTAEAMSAGRKMAPFPSTVAKTEELEEAKQALLDYIAELEEEVR